jgi:hypothetical protein
LNIIKLFLPLRTHLNFKYLSVRLAIPYFYSNCVLYLAGLGAGITETLIVVNPSEVVKIRLQSSALPGKYRNAPQAFVTIVKEEGAMALYRGVTLTAARQG